MKKQIFIDNALIGFGQEEKHIEDENGIYEIKWCQTAGIQVSENLIIEQFHSPCETKKEFVQELKDYCKNNGIVFEEREVIE